MFIHQKVHVLTKNRVPSFLEMALIAGIALPCSLSSPLVAASKLRPSNVGPQSFSLVSLPKKEPIEIDSPRQYGDRYTLRTKKSELVATSLDPKKYLFAKEAFLEEKRDEAIALIRQELDSGHTPNRQNQLLLLGQLYAEKYMELSYRETELYTERLQEYEKKKAEDKKAKAPQLDSSRSRRYLKDSLSLFYSLERESPKHPKIDEIMYFIGFVEMELGNRAKGARYLEQVVKRFHQSAKYPDALIHLGDYYFEKNDFKNASVEYRILSKKNESPLQPYAVYKLAWCELNMGQAKAGLKDMKKLIDGLQDASEKSKFNLREQALRDISIFFVDAGVVSEAYPFFKEREGEDKAIDQLKLIGDMLRGKAQDTAAIEAYRLILKERPDHLEAPWILLGIYEAEAAMGKTAAAVNTLVSAMKQYHPGSDWDDRYSGSAEQKKKIFDAVAEEGKKAGLFYHAAAQKGKDKSLFVQASLIYGSFLENFPNHPEHRKVQFYQGEILFAQSKWMAAADAYLKVVDSEAPKNIEDKKAEKLESEALYNALLALDNLTAASAKIVRFKPEELAKLDTSPEELNPAEQKFIQVAERYLKENPKSDRIVDIKYRIGSIYYRHKHFDEALKQYDWIITQHPDHKVAAFCAYLTLDVYQIRNDLDGMENQAGRYYLVTSLGDAKFKGEMKELSGEIGFKKLEKLEAAQDWAKAGDSYFKFYENSPKGALAEKSLYNAYVSYQKAENPAKALETSKLFLEKFPKSEHSADLALGAAKAAEESYDFPLAQTLYEKFKQNHPQHKEARKALFNAALYAELLGHSESAVKLYGEYLKEGSVPVDEHRAIELSLIKIQTRQKDLAKLDKSLRQLIKESKSYKEKMGYLAELTKQYELAGKMPERDRLVREITSMFESASDADKKNFGPALEYVAESKFNSLKREKESYEKLDLVFPPKELIYRLGKKQKMLKAFIAHLDKVIDIGVPAWGVAALYYKGESHKHFQDVFKKIKIPGKYSPEEQKQAQDSLKQIEKDMIEPLGQKAKEYALACLERGKEFHVISEFTQKCADLAQQESPLFSAFSSKSFWPSRIVPLSGFQFGWKGSIPESKNTEKYLAYLASVDAVTPSAEIEKRIRAFMVENPQEERATFLFANHAWNTGHKEMGEYFFNKLLNNPDFVWRALIFNQYGVQAMEEKRPTVALDWFEKSKAANPPYAPACANLANFYLESRGYVEAETLFSQALKMNPDWEEAALGVGVSLEGQGRYQEANKFYEDFFDDHNQALRVLYNQSVLLGNRLNERAQAARLMTQYLKLGGKDTARAQKNLESWR